MKFYIFLLSFFLLSAYSVAAQKYDYQWPFGYGANFENNFGVSILDFNDQSTTVSPFAETETFNMGYASSFICNAEGQLILMTNNCVVLDRNFNVVEGADTLTPGVIYDEYCHSSFGSSYPSGQCSMFLPEYGNDSTYYLINKDIEISFIMEDVISKNTYLNVIVRRDDGSFYVKERQKLIDNMHMVSRRLTACIHSNGEQWWTWAINYNSNRFYKFLIGGEDLLQGPIIQEIGIDLKSKDMDIGQASFSPNGQLLAINSETYGLLLYDFDNSTGELSNFRTISYPNMHTGNGLAFSPSSRFIYSTTADDMYQIDLEEQDTSQRVFHIGRFRSQAEDGWPVGLGNMYLGPDCRIYVAPGTTTWYMHVIHQPDEKGAACNFEERAIRAPTNLEFGFPNIPMYRFGGDCDSSISWGIVSATAPPIQADEVGVVIYPNPATDVLQIKVADNIKLPIAIDFFNVLGQKIHSELIISLQQTIDLSTLPSGVLFYHLSREGQMLKSGKIEKL